MGQVVAKKVEHFDDCVKAFRRYEEEKAEFEKKHQKYCRSCRGWGGHWYRYDPSPSGASLSRGYMEDFSECGDCIEKGICPWCGGPLDQKALDERGDLICVSRCGWENEEKSQGLPEEPECWCDYRRESGDETGAP
jgi:hypothetical protein